jgi:hypothetical protein
MASTSEARLLRWAEKVYGFMLRAYPREFRRDYSHEMMLLFKRQIRDAVSVDGVRGVRRFAVRIASDWIHTVFREVVTMTSRIAVFRWVVALPAALLAADAVRLAVGRVGALIMSSNPDFQYINVMLDVMLLFMAVAFLWVGVAIAPHRKGSVARLGLVVVVAWALAGMLFPAIVRWVGGPQSAVCVVIGGALAYLPWRGQRSSISANA